MRDTVLWHVITLVLALATAVVVVVGGIALVVFADGWLRWVGVGLLVLFGIAGVQTVIEARRPRERFNAYDDFRPYR